MIKIEDRLFLAALKGIQVKRTPFWFMRQAGRYLPEYREIRNRCKNFMDLCYTPNLAAEVTLQPIRRFDMDAAILFSDILVVPHALGMEVRFETGDGPRLGGIEIEKEDGLEKLSVSGVRKSLAPVFETVRLVRAGLSEEKALIGFAGAPWTLACYMIEGKGSRDFQKARLMAIRNPRLFGALMEMLTQATVDYLSAQIEAGVDAVQLFDSWAGIASEPEFRDYVIAPARVITGAIKARFPEIPIIGFPKGAGQNYQAYAMQTGVNAVGIDSSVSLAWVREALQPHCVVQGNLDPLLVAGNLPVALAQAGRILEQWQDKPFVFNLGHGMVPDTPVEHVKALCDILKHTP